MTQATASPDTRLAEPCTHLTLPKVIVKELAPLLAGGHVFLRYGHNSSPSAGAARPPSPVVSLGAWAETARGSPNAGLDVERAGVATPWRGQHEVVVVMDRENREGI